MPMSSTVFLNKGKNGKPRKGNWNYRSVIGIINFLVKSTYLELNFSVHQHARFCDDPKLNHENAVQ